MMQTCICEKSDLLETCGRFSEGTEIELRVVTAVAYRTMPVLMGR